MNSYGWLQKVPFGSYGWDASGAGGVDPYSGALLKVDFTDGSTTPEVGPAATFTRASSVWWPNANDDSSMTEFTAGNPAIEVFPYGTSFTDGGLGMQGGLKNWILQSNNPATTWTSVGSPSSITDNTNNGPDGGTNTAGEIVATGSGDGIVQTSGATALGAYVCASVFVKCSSGTLGGNVTIRGSTGGTPEDGSEAFTATTTWQRVVFSKKFTSSATGSVQMEVTTTGAGTLYVWGMQLESSEGVTRNVWNSSMAFVPTTTVAVTATKDACDYNSVTDLSNCFAAGTMMLWVWVPDNAVGSASQPVMMSIGNQIISIEKAAGDNDFLARYNGSAVTSLKTSGALTANQWAHMAYTWDQPNQEFKLYADGAIASTVTGYAATLVSGQTNVAVGQPAGGGNDTSRAWSIVSRARIFPSVKDATEIATFYNLERGNYQ